VEHFSEVFEKIDMETSVAAAIFHWKVVSIEVVKIYMRDIGREAR